MKYVIVDMAMNTNELKVILCFRDYEFAVMIRSTITIHTG